MKLIFEDFINELKIQSLLIFKDSRGSLKKLPALDSFHAEEVFYTSNKRSTFRGMHLQWGSHSTSKRVTVLKGNLKQLLVDCRPDSSSFLHAVWVDLLETEPKSVTIPAGVAQGYVSLSEESLVLYEMDGSFCQICDVGFLTPEIRNLFENIAREPLIMSERDSKLDQEVSPKWH